MKKFLLVISLFLSCLSHPVYAGGGITHMFIAQETIALLPDAKLRNLLLDNLDAYTVGAYYPDSGYVGDNRYGEDSHWDPFINAFANYIKEKYPDPIAQNPKLIAFLFGCASHRVSDEIIHWTFYPISTVKDFNGDASQAHKYGDFGIDILVNMDKNQWFTLPALWWVPVADLVAVYHRMGKDQYTADQIVKGNTALYFASYGERIISAPVYVYLRWKMPWTAAHYYDWPEGGIKMDERQVAAYQMRLWQQFNAKSTTKMATSTASIERVYGPVTDSPSIAFATSAINSGTVHIEAKSNDDGSIELQSPVINQAKKLETLLSQFLARVTK
jgi:hypothetical protein